VSRASVPPQGGGACLAALLAADLAGYSPLMGARTRKAVVALAPGDAPGALDLNKLFVEPRHIRGGVGRALLAHAVAEARQRGAGNRWPSFLVGRSK